MTSYFVNPAPFPAELQVLIQQINIQLSTIAKDISKVSGVQGKSLNMGGNQINNVADATRSRDALSLGMADDRYVKRTSGLKAGTKGVGATP